MLKLEEICYNVTSIKKGYIYEKRIFFNIKNKLIAILLTIFMIMATIPSTVFATENTANVSTKDDFLTVLSDASVTNINITSDIDLTDIPAGAGNVIDLDGRTIDLCGNKITANNFSVIYQGSNFTIKNGTFDANGGQYALFIGDEGTTDNVLIQNIKTNGGINVYNSKNVVLRDVNVTGGSTYYALWCDEGGQVKIESGTFQTNGAAVLGMAEGDVNSTLDIKGGTFNTNGKPLVLEADGKNYGDPVITAGTFDCSAKEYVADGLEFERNSSGIYTYHETMQDALKGADSNTIITAVDNPASVESTFTATLEYNNGSGMSVKIVADASGNITLPVLERSGYIFLGWDAGDGKTISGNQVYNLTGNKTLVASWKVLTKVKTEAKDATCVREGNIEYWYCPELDSYYSDEALTNIIAIEDTVIPATGNHNYKDGKCSVCGKVDPNYKADKPNEPSKPNNNKSQDKNTNDDTSSEKNIETPKTSDDNNLILWVAVMAFAGIGIVGTIFIRTKEENK